MANDVARGCAGLISPFLLGGRVAWDTGTRVELKPLLNFLDKSSHLCKMEGYSSLRHLSLIEVLMQAICAAKQKKIILIARLFSQRINGLL